MPYTAEYFNVPYGDFAGEKELDVEGVLEKTDRVDDYVRNEIVSKGLKDEVATYKSLMAELEEKVGASKHEEDMNKLQRIYNYILTLVEDRGMEKLKEQLYG